MKCSKCGGEIDASMPFCIHCGAAIGGALQKSESRKQMPINDPQKQNGMIIVIGIVAAFVFIVCGVLIFRFLDIGSEKKEDVSAENSAEENMVAETVPEKNSSVEMVTETEQADSVELESSIPKTSEIVPVAEADIPSDGDMVGSESFSEDMVNTTRQEKISVFSVEVSSELPPQKDKYGQRKSYGGEKLIDGNIETPWVEGVQGSGEGEKVVLHLAKQEKVSGILIYSGYLESEELFDKNGKPTYVRVDFGNGNVQDANLAVQGYENSRMNPNAIWLPQPVVTDTITVAILGAQAGDKFDDTCIGEIVVK